MSNNPFHDLADQYDILTESLRTLGDQWGTGTLSVGAVVEDEPKDEPKDQPSQSKDTPKK